jgi:hypothetical protein
VRYIAVWIVNGFLAGKLKEKDLKYWFPVVELVLHIYTNQYLFILNTFSKLSKSIGNK